MNFVLNILFIFVRLMADLCIFFSVGINIVLQAPFEKISFIVVTMGLCFVGRVCNIFRKHSRRTLEKRLKNVVFYSQF